MAVTQGRNADTSGIFLSGLCLLHCLALPLLSGVAPMVGVLAEDWRVHFGLLLLILPVAWLAFGKEWVEGRQSWPLPSVAVLGVMLLVAALFAPHDLEVYLTVTGGLCLAVAHALNLRAHSSHVCPAKPDA